MSKSIRKAWESVAADIAAKHRIWRDVLTSLEGDDEPEVTPAQIQEPPQTPKQPVSEPPKTPQCPSERTTETSTPVEVRVINAAWQLKEDGKRVSVRGACKLAGVDRSNFARRHPRVAMLIRSLIRSDHDRPRGLRDPRTGFADGSVDD
jgi:hypothetical protein